jgi:hypothetical protein
VSVCVCDRHVSLTHTHTTSGQVKTPSAIIPLEQLAVREVELGGVLDMASGARFAFELYNPDNEVQAIARSREHPFPACIDPR